MGLKDLLVHVDGTRGHEARLRTAAELARRSEAHLTGLFVIEPVNFAGFFSSGGADLAQAEALQAIQEQHERARRALAERLGAAFRTRIDDAGVLGEWHVAQGDPGERVTLRGRYADLVILGQSDPDAPSLGSAVPEAVLLGSGRPVLVVPYIGADRPIGHRVLVAWNGSREAARAVNDAVPLVASGGRVTVLAINPARGIAGDGDLPAADMAHHLARHGITAEAAHTTADDIAVGDLILSRAADMGADLIVMGGYGHSRAREFVLGGATRALLGHMTVPVLFSH
jgi:nucleotide-binding universal stress UspA family protein